MYGASSWLYEVLQGPNCTLASIVPFYNVSILLFFFCMHVRYFSLIIHSSVLPILNSLVRPRSITRLTRVKKIVREPKWSRSNPSMIMLESEDGNKGTLHQKRVRQRGKTLTDTRTTIRSLSETLQTTTLPSSPLYLVPSAHTLHMVTT